MANKQKATKRETTIAEAEATLREARKAAAYKCLRAELAVNVPTAAVLLGLSRAHVYDLIHENTFPVPVIKLGRTFRVPTQALRDLLLVREVPPEGTTKQRRLRAVAGVSATMGATTVA
jgi:excisionase family DNA binding protein